MYLNQPNRLKMYLTLNFVRLDKLMIKILSRFPEQKWEMGDLDSNHKVGRLLESVAWQFIGSRSLLPNWKKVPGVRRNNIYIVVPRKIEQNHILHCTTEDRIRSYLL